MNPQQLAAMLNTMIIPQLRSMSDDDFCAVRAKALEVLYEESTRRGLLDAGEGGGENAS